MSSTIRDRIRELRRVRAGDLHPHPANWRRHPQNQINALRASLEEIGIAGALLAYEEKKGRIVVIDGHLRQDLDPHIQWPVLLLDVTTAEAKKLLVTYDPIAALAETDTDAIKALLEDVHFELPEFEHVIDVLFPSSAPGTASIEEPPTPEPPDEAITKRGDIWQLGVHRLMCGDSACSADVDRLVDRNTIHLVNTDPPYNVKVEPRSNNAIAAGLSSFEAKHHQRFDAERRPSTRKPTSSKMRAKDRPLENDFVTDEEFDRLLLAWFGEISRVLIPGGGFYIWGGYANCANYPSALKASKLYFSQAIIWVKEHPVLTRKDFMGNHEWCFYGWREGAAHKFYGPPNVPDVWSIKKVNPNAMVHLTEKPVELASRAIQYSSKRGQNVLDLFGGSGSTLLAAEQLSRSAFLMELDALYCDVIVERWQQFTGKKAKRTTEKTPRRRGAKKAVKA